VRSDLQVALRKLVTDRERGLIPYFKRVVIETSGLADPGPILRTFATDRALGGEYYVDAVIAAADAVNGLSTLTEFPEARRQAIVADTIIVTKSDLAPSDKCQDLIVQLRSLNPRADIVQAHHGKAEECVFTSGGAPSLSDGNAFLAEAVHADRIGSFTLTWKRPLQWPVVARAMETLLALRGGDILRAKGLLNIEGCAGPVVVQFVQHLAHPPAELQIWPDGDRISRLVFITRNIGERDVKALFEAVDHLSIRPGESGPGPSE
jgi:G3E family GTPase